MIEERTRVNAQFFADESARIAELCLLMAGRFSAGGRLLAVATEPQALSDARHVAVEFVHPVLVGKRALPALAVSPQQLELVAEPGDMVIAFGERVETRDGCLTIAFEDAAGEYVFLPPTDDPFVRQELVETLYHVLWESVHVFLEHLGSSSTGAGASAFLYPFLSNSASDLDAVVADVARSVIEKANDVGELRRRLVGDGSELAAVATVVREQLDRGATLIAFGNGGSATDAMDVVADFQAAPQGWRSLRALDLTADAAVLTALANDVGPEVIFQRQVIAHGTAGDVAIAFSTSGASASIIQGLAEARRRGLVTIALVGYDGGRIAEESLADHVVIAPSEYVPRIQEAHATAYHLIRELVETGVPSTRRPSALRAT